MLELSSKRRRPFVGVVFHWAHTFQRSRPHQNDIRHEPKLTGSGYPHRRSGSEADSMSRGEYPVAGRPSSKSSSIGHIRSNEAALTRATPDRNRSAPGAGTPTGDFWKRSGQHEPRRVPGHGAPSIEVVFRQALPVLFSQWTCPTSTRTPPPAAAAPAHPGSFVPPTARNRAMAHP